MIGIGIELHRLSVFLLHTFILTLDTSGVALVFSARRLRAGRHGVVAVFVVAGGCVSRPVEAGGGGGSGLFLRGARERLNATALSLAGALVVVAGGPAVARLFPRVALELVLARRQLGGVVGRRFARGGVFALHGVADDAQTLAPAFQRVTQRPVRVRVAALGLAFQRGRRRRAAAAGRRRAGRHRRGGGALARRAGAGAAAAAFAAAAGRLERGLVLVRPPPMSSSPPSKSASSNLGAGAFGRSGECFESSCAESPSAPAPASPPRSPASVFRSFSSSSSPRPPPAPAPVGPPARPRHPRRRRGRLRRRRPRSRLPRCFLPPPSPRRPRPPP